MTNFPELLKSETSQVDFAGPTLPSLKLLLDRQAGLKDPADKYAKLVHGILSACLLNIDEMRCVSADPPSLTPDCSSEVVKA